MLRFLREARLCLYLAFCTAKTTISSNLALFVEIPSLCYHPNHWLAQSGNSDKI